MMMRGWLLAVWLLGGCDVVFHIDRYPPSDPDVVFQQVAVDKGIPGVQVDVTLALPQQAGDLIVMMIGSSSMVSVVGVTDTAGDTFQRAGMTMSSTSLAQTVYYAQDIAATSGANTISISYSAVDTTPDVRVAEYSGVATTGVLDVAAGAVGAGSGSDLAMDTGEITTTYQRDLLVAGSFVGGLTTKADPTFTPRVVSDGGNLLEDRVVDGVGAYHAGATQDTNGGNGAWVMSIAAFKSR